MGLGRTLILIGLFFVAAGLILSMAGRIPWVGRLPGDIAWRRGNMTFYFPLMTLILVNLAIAGLMWLWNRR